jgi:hypothetical protein
MRCCLEEHEYEIYSPIIPRGGYARDFFLPESDGELSDQLAIIVDGEGPVLKSAVMKRLAKAWGLERFDQKVEARLSSLFPDSISANGAEEDFVWHEARIGPKTYHFRGSCFYPSSRRKVQEVCLEELGNVSLYVLESVEELNVEELTRRVCRIIGTSSSDLARERINRALRIDFIRNEIHIDGDTIKLSKFY